MTISGWMDHPYEQKMRARHKEYKAGKGKSPLDKLADKVKDIRDGTKRCACGCGKTGDMFRGGRMYNSKCLGSKWESSKLPQDRTPPKTWKYSRDQRSRVNAEHRYESRHTRWNGDER